MAVWLAGVKKQSCLSTVLVILSNVDTIFSSLKIAEHLGYSNNSANYSLQVSTFKLTFRTADQQNEQQHWHFYLDGVKLERIMPEDWNITRTNSSISLHTTAAVNYEVLSRSGGQITIKKVISFKESEVLIFPVRAIWTAESNFTCSPETMGDMCSECNKAKGAERVMSLGGVCRFSDKLLTKNNYFVEKYLFSVIAGALLMVALVGSIVLIYIRIRKTKDFHSAGGETQPSAKTSRLPSSVNNDSAIKPLPISAMKSAISLPPGSTLERNAPFTGGSSVTAAKSVAHLSPPPSMVQVVQDGQKDNKGFSEPD